MKLYCDTCGKGFERSPSRIKNRFRFCSRECINYSWGTRRKLPFQWAYNKLLHYAKVHSWQVLIRYEDFVTFTAITNCHYCGADITWNPHVRNAKQYLGYNLDRKDSTQGYTFNNLVVCCDRCNKAKGDRFTYDEWLQIGQVIKTFAASA